MAYTDVTSVKQYLKISSSDDDTLLAAFVARAQQMVDVYTGRTFEASTNTSRYFDCTRPTVDGRTLYLDRDLCSINSITNGDGSTIASTYYVTEPRNDTPYYAITLKASSGYSWTFTDDPENAITISGKWAYSASAPVDIAQATVRLAGWLYRQRDNKTFGTEAFPEVGMVVTPDSFPRDVSMILNPYRKRH